MRAGFCQPWATWDWLNHPCIIEMIYSPLFLESGQEIRFGLTSRTQQILWQECPTQVLTIAEIQWWYMDKHFFLWVEKHTKLFILVISPWISFCQLTTKLSIQRSVCHAVTILSKYVPMELLTWKWSSSLLHACMHAGRQLLLSFSQKQASKQTNRRPDLLFIPSTFFSFIILGSKFVCLSV